MAPASKSPFLTDTDPAPLPAVVDALEPEPVADAEVVDPLPDVVDEPLAVAAPKTPPWTVAGDEPWAF